MASLGRTRSVAFRLLIPALFWLTISGGRPIQATVGEIGVITAARLNVRPSPGTDGAPIAVFQKDTAVNVLEHKNGWVRIQHGDRIGWVKNRPIYIRLENAGDASGRSEPVDDPKVHSAREKVREIRRQIQEGKAEVADFSRKEMAMVNSLDEIDFALNAAINRQNELKGELAALDKKIPATEAAIARIGDQLAQNRDYASKRLVAWYKLNRIGRIHYLASADSIYELFQREAILKRILDNDLKVLSDLVRDQTDRQQLLNLQRTQQTAKSSLEASVAKHMRSMGRQQKRRRELLKEIRSKKSLQLAVLASLKQSAGELDDKIQLLSRQAVLSEPTVKSSTERFNTLKGLLKMPVEGKVISYFGPYQNRRFNVINYKSGIDIRAEKGEPVRAVCFGNVIYANWFKGYGNMLIIDHGQHYYTVYANIQELFKRPGDGVQTGEVVATVGDSGSQIGPKLYFEIRHHGKPVDPLPWIDKG